MMTMQFDYADAAKPNSDDVQYYTEAVNEEEGEMGYSVYSVSDTSVSEKLSEDESILGKYTARLQICIVLRWRKFR